MSRPSTAPTITNPWQTMLNLLDGLPHLAIQAQRAILDDLPHDGRVAAAVIAAGALVDSYDQALREMLAHSQARREAEREGARA